MIVPVLSGLVVSVDAFFIGLSLGLQERCKLLYLAVINVFLFGLCVLGFLLAGLVYGRITFDTDLVVGLSFIALGLWCIVHYFASVYLSGRRLGRENTSLRTIIIVGAVMSLEAMLITMGITFLLPNASFLVPVAVGAAHFGYSALSFSLARGRHMQRIPVVLSHVISGAALVIYGLMAIFVELGVG